MKQKQTEEFQLKYLKHQKIYAFHRCFLFLPKTIKYIELELLRRFIYDMNGVKSSVWTAEWSGVRVTIVDQHSTKDNFIAKYQ